MLNKRKERQEFLNKLKKFGLQITTEGTVIEPAKLPFKTLYERVLWLLNETPNYLTVDSISKYLGEKYKSVSKAITKLYRDDKGKTDYLKRIKVAGLLSYRADIPNNLDIPTAFKVIKDLGVRKNNQDVKVVEVPTAPKEIESDSMVSALRQILNDENLEIVIRRKTSA